MTWSILARDEQGHFGMAIASRFFAVGSLCLHARRGVGVLSTQALMNPLYGPAALDHLGHGHTAAQAIASVVAGDAGREHKHGVEHLRVIRSERLESFNDNRSLVAHDLPPSSVNTCSISDRRM